MKFLQNFFGKTTCFICLLVFLVIAAPAQATTWDFNDGTNQEWTVTFNTDLSFPNFVAAEWSSYPDYSGDPTIGRPPGYGPNSNVDDDLGAISGSTDLMAQDPEWTYSIFASPIFTAQEIDTISTQFSVGAVESGINETTNVSGRVGYSVEGGGVFMGEFFNLNTEPPNLESKIPLWTMASMNVTAEVLVNQIFVSVWVDGSTDASGTQHWIDDVSFNPVSGPGPEDPPAVPEPATMLLFGLGILGLAGVSRKR